MISNREKWSYFAKEKLSALSRRITLKNNGDFYSLNCVRNFRIKKLQPFKKLCESLDFSNVIMPS